jgi:putative ABC transport system permease protein
LAALLRAKTRSLLTLLSVVAAFLLFGMLDSTRVAFNAGASVNGVDRMVVVSRLSITQMLPYSLLSQISTVKGVKKAAYVAWFGGIYQDPKNFFPNFSVSSDYMDMVPELELSPEERKAWDQDQSGAIVGASLAKQHGWKIGDTIPLQATIFPQKGSNNWTFKLDGIFHAKDTTQQQRENQLFFHWKYFDEANDYVKGRVGWYMVRIESPDQAAQVAKAIDAISQNSDHETKTQSEDQFRLSFAKQFADIGLIVTAIMGAVFFTLVLLTGNTMAQSVRERIPEFAILKTIGFSNITILLLVLTEGVALVSSGGLIGLALAAVLMPVIKEASGNVVPLPNMLLQSWMAGIGLMILIGIAIGAIPALRAMRLSIVDALAGR